MKKWIYLNLTACAILFVVWSCNNDDDTTTPGADTNTAPTLDAKTLNAAENVLGGQKIGDITAQDEDGDPLEFTLSGDTPFLLSKTGELTLAEDEQLDYEDVTEYELNVSVSDGTASDNGTITLKVMDIDEAPEFELEFFQFGTQEGKDNTEPIGTIEATDPEGATLEYSITENDQDLFTIDKATGAIRVAEGKTLNFEAFEGEEAVYNIIVQATDQENQTSIAVRITLADGDEFPVFGETEYTFKVEETKLEIGSVSATDPENDPLTYSIAANDGELFVINAETGKITLAEGKTMDFEAFGEGETPEYNITVQATDPGENMTQVSVTIEITDVEEAPTVTTEGFEIAENSTEVGKVLATDPQEDAITFSLAPDGDADGLFAISDDGTVQVTEGNTLDYEAEVKAYQITVVVEDNFGNSTEATIPITVTNVDEAPELDANAQTEFTSDENVTEDYVIGTLLASDPEGENITFEIFGNNTLFEIDANGNLSLIDGQELDYEIFNGDNPVYNFTVRMEDESGNILEELIQITVADVLGDTLAEDSNSFVTTWFAEANEEITIGVNGDNYEYSFTVEWGDGSVEEFVDSDVDDNRFSHTYNKTGTYTIAIQNNFPQMRMLGNDLSNDNLRSIEQWGNIEWESFSVTFINCQNMIYNATDVPDLTQVENMSAMFRFASNFDGDLSGWNTVNITNMSEMFLNATSFNGNIGNWDTQNVNNMSFMFQGATDFNQDLSNWNTQNLEDTEKMFFGATSFDQNLGSWNIESLVDATGMFNGLSGLSDDNYRSTLIGWVILDDGEAQIPNGVSFGAFGRFVCANSDAEAARNFLEDDKGWTINDGGTLICDD
ncbi:MAG: BspA family leucine-rich repeat surface protein [Bacteroidota bacterium]